LETIYATFTMVSKTLRENKVTVYELTLRERVS